MNDYEKGNNKNDVVQLDEKKKKIKKDLQLLVTSFMNSPKEEKAYQFKGN